MKPRALDLFCKAGGMTRGLQLAGWHVTGNDIDAQPHYVGDAFIQGDALKIGLDGYDAIVASPPCQAYTQSALSQRNAGKVYPDLLGPIRERLRQTGTPWVIENVPGAPMRPDVMLCGSMFGERRLARHRWFEFWEPQPPWVGFSCNHGQIISVVGHGTPSWVRKQLGRNPSIAEYREIMGIDWMNRNELSEAIPPTYGLWIGTHLMNALKAASMTLEPQREPQ